MSFILTHFSCELTPSLVLGPPSRQLPVRSSCSPAVAPVCVTLFLHGYDWACHLPSLPHRCPSSPISFPLAAFLPMSLSSHCSCPERIVEGGLLCPVQVSRVGEKGAPSLRLAYCQGGRLFSPGIPHLWQVLTHMSQPVSPGLLSLCGRTLLLSVWLDTHKRPGSATTLLVPHEWFMLRHSSTLHSSPYWFEVRKGNTSVEWCQREQLDWIYSGVNEWI